MRGRIIIKMGTIYNILPITNAKDYFDKCIEAVTGESKIVRQMKGLIPLFFSLAVADTAIGITTNRLKKSGLIKHSSPKA